MTQILIRLRSIPEGNQLRTYLFIVLGFAVLFALITPPNQVPDEADHFYRSYEVSTGQFIPNRHPNFIPVGFEEIQELKAIETLSGRLELLGKKYDYQDTKEYATHSTYPILVYLPQGFGIAVGRLLHLPLGIIYVLGRLFNALVYVGVLFLSLRIMPGKHWLLMLLLSTPMAIYEAGSFSPDALTNALGLFFISLVLAVSKSETPFTKKQLLGLFLVTWLLSQGKANLAPLALMLLMVPWQRFGGIPKKILFLVACFCALLVTFAIWERVSPNQPWALAPGSDPNGQLLYVVLYPFTFLQTLIETLSSGWVTILKSWFGAFGWFSTFMPQVILAVYFVVLVFVTAVSDEEYPLSVWKKWVSGITWFVCVAFTGMLLYLVWTPYGAELIQGMQGRYLIPFAPLIFFLIPNFLKPYPFLKRYQGLVATVASSLMLIIAATIVILRFYIPCGMSYYSLTACYLPVEDWKGNGIPLEPIVEGTVIEQVIIPECNKFYRVKLHADTFDRFNHSYLEVIVFDKETQEEIDRETIDNTYLSEDPKVFVQFDPIVNSKGRTYIVRVTSDAIPDTAVTLNRSEGDQYLPGQLSINGEVQDGDLIFEYGCKLGVN